MEVYERLKGLNRELFEILSSLFREGFGSDPTSFAAMDLFPEKIRSLSVKDAKRLWGSMSAHEPALRDFYAKNAVELFSLSREVGGLKYVIGGGSRFDATQFGAVKNMVLYGDTILVPDPIFPWLEAERSEERFRHVLLVQQVFNILHLKPLIDADLPYPAVAVFPSFEKTLEMNDPSTWAQIERSLIAFYSYYMGKPFKSLDETRAFARSDPSAFLSAVERSDLFWAPGQTEPRPIKEAIELYRADMAQWRSKEYLETISKLSPAELVWVGTFERFVPQFHWLDNVESLGASPLACIEGQWHHFQLYSRMLNAIVGSAQTQPVDPIDSYLQLNQEPFQWLGNLSILDLVELRLQRANETFRTSIRTAIERLKFSSIDDAGRIAAEISQTIRSSIVEHQKVVKEINAKYLKKYGATIFSTAIGVPALFFPALAPLVGTVAPILVGGKLIWDLVEHLGELRKASKSMLGVFARVAKPTA